MSAKKPRVLVVEDDATMREAYAAYLDDLTDLRAVSDGFQASQLVKTEAFDIVVLDVRLPNMNGLQIAAIARSSLLNRRTPLFVVSGALDEAGRRRAAALGGVTVREKPIAMDVLAADILRLTAPKPQSGFDARVINAVLAAAAEVLGGSVTREKISFGKPNVATGPARRHNGVAGLIGIGGASFAGSLAFSASTTLLDGLGAQLLPGMTGPLDPEMRADLMGELANQLCGRLKQELAKLGIKANIGLPEVVAGTDFVLAHKAETPVLNVPMKVLDSVASLEFCMAARSGFVLDESKAEATVTGVLMFD